MTCDFLVPAFESSSFNRIRPPFRRIVLCFLERRLLSAQLTLSRTMSPSSHNLPSSVRKSWWRARRAMRATRLLW